MIGIITHNRLGLLKLSMESLFRSELYGEDIYVSDDCSAADTVRYLEGLADKNVELALNTVNIGADRNTCLLCDRLSTLVPWFAISGSDVIYSKGWYHQLENTYNYYTCQNKVAMVGGFLGTNHQRIRAELEYVYSVESLTGVTLVSSAFWKEARKLGLIDPLECDVSMSRAAQTMGQLVLCVKSSLVQHIGINEGLHLEGFDVGVRFVGEDKGLSYDWKRSNGAVIRERYKHNGVTDLILWSDGTCDFGERVGKWQVTSNGQLFVRDEAWDHHLKPLFGPNASILGYTGIAYPCGTAVVGCGRPVTGIKL